MNKKFRYISLIIFVLAVGILLIAPSAYGKYLKNIYVIEGGSMTIVPQFEKYVVYFHTYDENGDTLYDQTMVKDKSETIIMPAAPKTDIFCGWTFSGMYPMNFESPDVKVFSPNDEVTFASLVTSLGTETYEIHLYDVYETSPTLTAAVHPMDKIVGPKTVSSYDHNAHTPYSFRSRTTIGDEFIIQNKKNENGYKEALYFKSRKSSTAYSVYYHPGVGVKVGQESIGSDLTYVTEYSTDKTSLKLDYENLGVSGETIRYVGIDKKVETAYIVYYHSYNEYGDFCLDYYDEYFYDGQTNSIYNSVVFREQPTTEENPYVQGRTFRGWTLVGIVHANGGSDNVTEYKTGIYGLASDMYESQGGYMTDADGDKCIRLFDVYESTAQIILHGRETYQHYFEFVDVSSDYGVLGTVSDDSNISFVMTTPQDTHRFYYHPGIIIRSDSELREAGVDSYAWQSLKSDVGDDPNGYIWANSQLRDDGSSDPGYIYTGENPPRIDDINHQNMSFTYDGTIDIYCCEHLKNSSSGGTCFAEGTLITLADGRRIPVEELKGDEELLVYDHEKGIYTTASILFIENDGVDEYNIINLKFSDGTHSKLIYEHGLFDLDLNKYVYITEENYANFIGHRFAKEKNDGYDIVILQDAYITQEVIGCYSLTTNYHMNYFIDGLFSMPGGITGLFNYFEYGENLGYNNEKMQADIEKYGLYTAEDFAQYLPEEIFNTIYPVKYLKVSVAKGLMTFEDILAIIERYVKGHDLIK